MRWEELDSRKGETAGDRRDGIAGKCGVHSYQICIIVLPIIIACNPSFKITCIQKFLYLLQQYCSGFLYSVNMLELHIQLSNGHKDLSLISMVTKYTLGLHGKGVYFLISMGT